MVGTHVTGLRKWYLVHGRDYLRAFTGLLFVAGGILFWAWDGEETVGVVGIASGLVMLGLTFWVLARRRTVDSPRSPAAS